MHTQIHFGRTFRHVVQFVLTGLCYIGCTYEGDLSSEGVDDDHSWILLTVNLPDATLPSTRADSRQASLETAISEIRLLVFEDAGEGYLFRYQIAGSEMEPVGDYQRFRARVSVSERPTKLIVVANASAALSAYEPSAGTPESEVRASCELAFTTSGLSANLPMYGETLFPTGFGTGDNYITMHALRSIARVDVVKNLQEDSEDFTLESVYVFRANDRIRVIPDAIEDPSSPKVDAPSIPDGVQFLATPLSTIVPEGADAIGYIYIPESRAATNDEILDGSTVVVVGGRFGGGDNEVTYYRADFDPGLAEHPFGQVLRNHLYTFNIVRVSAPGWGTAEEAANRFATSIVFDIEAWEDFSADLYFGVDQFALSSREISLGYIDGLERRIDVESEINYTIQWVGADGNPIDDGTSQRDVTISNANFDATIVQDSGDPSGVSHLLFRTRNNNYDDQFITDLLRVTVNNWSVEITVRQENTAVHSNRSFSVLTAHDYSYPFGNLGTTFNPQAASYSGLAMRRMLDKQFAPNGRIRIKGFTFELLNDNTLVTYSVSTSNAAALEDMRRSFQLHDVIFTSYETELSNAVAELLLEWLDENPRRVLIVSTDNNNTNANLLSRLTNDATWTYLSTGTYQFLTATATVESQEFFAGPFGNVTTNATITKADQYFGYTAVYSTEIIPLIRQNSMQNSIVVGINKNRRIWYLGDANLFQTNSMSNNDGDVQNDLDRMFANVWAWIVEQLIYGEE